MRSTNLALDRSQLLKKLGISEQSKLEVGFVGDHEFRSIGSRATSVKLPQGIEIDNRFINRFVKCGFNNLADFVQSKSELARRVLLSQEWLFDSRTEPRLSASLVKTAIALESLLILSESESLSQTLSERAAFILSSKPAKPQLISRIVKRFYDARSGVVHGSQKKAKRLTSSLVEIVDRFVIMLHLIIAANAAIWTSIDLLREWCELERWAAPSSEVSRPIPDMYLRNTLKMRQQELELKY